MKQNMQLWSFLDLINADAGTKFDKNPPINSQDSEHKQNSDVNQDPNSVEN